MKNPFYIFLLANILFFGTANAQLYRSFPTGNSSHLFSSAFLTANTYSASTYTKPPLSGINRYTFYSAAIDSLESDTAKTRKKIRWNSPGMVALQSALVPGLGQISNGKWHIVKVPVIYAGFAVCGYFINFNHQEYIKFRDAYRKRIDGDSTTIDIFDARHPENLEAERYTENTILRLRESYRQDRDLTIIITFGVYAANILDAYVFAHLKDFDVSDDLALHIKPVTFSNIAGRTHLTSGIQLKFK